MNRSSPVLDSFASADVVALVRRSLQDSGLDHDLPATRATSARVPFGAKRDYLAQIASRHGLGPLLNVGSQLGHVMQKPVVAALLAATDVPDLFDRWSRLETFLHSHHRVRVKNSGTGFLVAEHVSQGETPPADFEHMLIFGILSAALPLIGAEDVKASPDCGTTMLPFPSQSEVSADRNLRASSCWRFEWNPIIRPHQERPPSLENQDVNFAALVRADPTRRWTVAAAASCLHMSTRTFQRTLKLQGGFAEVVGEVRAERSAELLRETLEPLGAVAFVSGYSDQPHFSREFKRRTGLTPLNYRLLFQKTREMNS